MTGVGLNIVDGLSGGVGDANGFTDASVGNFFESFPCLLHGYFGSLDFFVVGIHPKAL